jgi:hypothetical protein
MGEPQRVTNRIPDIRFPQHAHTTLDIRGNASAWCGECGRYIYPDLAIFSATGTG